MSILRTAATEQPARAAPPDHLRLTDRMPLLHPAVVLFALLAFEWASVASLGGFSFRLPYLAIFYGLALAAATPGVVIAGAGLFARWWAFLLPYALYVMILYLVLHASEARGMAMRQVFFLVGFFVIAAWVAAAQDLRRLMRWAGAACLLVFVVGTEVIARGLGFGWWEAISRFVTRGDLDFVFYDFFRGVFNAFQDEGDDLIKASQKNSVAVTLMTALVALRAGGVAARRDWAGIGVTLLVLFLLLMLNSRSVLLVAVLGLGLVGVLRLFRDWRPNLVGAIGAVLVLLFFAAGLTALVYGDNAALAAIGERFAFEDDSASSRMAQYGWALQRIDGHILWGGGYAELDGHPVHNLMLGALMHAGLPAFLLVTAAYAGLIYAWIGFMARIVTAPAWWVLPLRPEWVAVLPLLPIVRVWLSGDAGHPGFAEWMALALFFGLLQANALRRLGLDTADQADPALR